MRTIDAVAGRESFFDGPALKRRYTVATIPIIGTVKIQSLTELERSGFEADRLNDEGQWDRKNGTMAKVKLIVLCCVDDEGNRLFIESDIPKLQELDSVVTDALFDACLNHCGFVSEDFEEAAKNSSETQGDDLP